MKHFLGILIISLLGQSGIGKTKVLLDFLSNHESVFGFKMQIIIAYGIWQNKFDEFKQTFPDTIFVSSIEGIEDYIQPKSIILIDDFMNTISYDRKANRYVSDLMTKRSHHLELGVIVTAQIASPHHFKAISMNSNLQMFFSNRRDLSYIVWVGRQFCPSRPRFLHEALLKTTKINPRNYIVLDLAPDTPELLRVRSGLIPDPYQEDFEIYYESSSS